MFASTSPSYLIMQSLDTANKYMSERYLSELARAVKDVEKLKNTLKNSGFELIENEPMKITAKTKAYGYTGTEFADILRQKNIEVEFADPDILVMMFTPQNGDCFEVIADTFMSMPKKTPISAAPPRFAVQKSFLSLREALLSPVEKVDLNDACGRICADVNASCPPAVPIVMPGEIVGESAVEALKYYGAESIDAVKE